MKRWCNQSLVPSSYPLWILILVHLLECRGLSKQRRRSRGRYKAGRVCYTIRDQSSIWILVQGSSVSDALLLLEVCEYVGVEGIMCVFVSGTGGV